MKNRKRWIISVVVGISIEGILFGLCWLTSRDLFNNGRDTKLSACFAYVALWGGWILKLLVDHLSDDSLFAGILAFFLYFILPTLVYSLITYVLLRPKKAA